MPRRVVVLLVAAFAFLGGAVGYFLGRSQPPGSGAADVRFLQDMILHHEQAVRMATTPMGPAAAADPAVSHFAREVLIFQQYEIGLMEAWLQRWGHPRASDDPHAGHDMPGMATEDQLVAYEAASGMEVDAGFLRLMTAHHRGGIQMVDDYRGRLQDRLVRELAERIARNQQKEIVEYEQLARRLGVS